MSFLAETKIKDKYTFFIFLIPSKLSKEIYDDHTMSTEYFNMKSEGRDIKQINSIFVDFRVPNSLCS